MIEYLRNRGLLKMTCCAALLFLMSASTLAETSGKIPRDVIDYTAAHGGALVLVGLAVPWQLESRLSQEELRAQRTAIASIQNDLLDKLAGKKFKVLRQYQEIPGIALEVGAEALAELARLPIVTNVLLDRPAGAAMPPPNRNASPRATAAGLVSSEKVPSTLFTRAARDGTVLVLAGLRTPWQHEEGLSEELWALQRNAIHSTQSYLLAELAGTRYKVTRLYGKIPGIALRVGVDALIVLEKSPAITNVVLDRPAQIRR
ncbi:MAG: hypothetical protein ACXW4O_15725 [Candidatus Binatia bacterium]